MGVTIQQKGLAQLYGRAATLAGQAQRARELEQRAIRQQEQLRSIEAQKEAQQMQVEQQRSMRMLDAQLDLEMYERSKRWEIDKMQLRSQVDFQREEQSRQRKLDSYDNALTQIDKEVQAGTMTEKEAEPYKLKINLNKQGVNVSVSELRQGQDEDRFGVDPYWMRGKDAPEGTPERQLYESKLQQEISGQRAGTIPYYLEPSFISTYPEAARQAQESRGIFLSDEEFESLKAETPNIPLANKQLDIGVRTEGEAERGIVEGLPVVASDADYDALPSGTEFTDQGGKRWRKP